MNNDPLESLLISHEEALRLLSNQTDARLDNYLRHMPANLRERLEMCINDRIARAVANERARRQAESGSGT